MALLDSTLILGTTDVQVPSVDDAAASFLGKFRRGELGKLIFDIQRWRNISLVRRSFWILKVDAMKLMKENKVCYQAIWSKKQSIYLKVFNYASSIKSIIPYFSISSITSSA